VENPLKKKSFWAKVAFFVGGVLSGQSVDWKAVVVSVLELVK